MTSTRQLGEEARGYPSATSAVEARLSALAAGRAPEPDIAVTVQKSEPVTSEVSRVLLMTAGKVTAANLEWAISRGFGDRVRYLQGSAHHAHSDNGDLIGAFVALNKPSKPADTAGMQGMKVVTANVFADTNDTIWRKIGEGDAAVLVQDTEDDLSALIATRRSHSIATASTECSLAEPYSGGEMVLWYDAAREVSRCGIAVNSRQVFEFDNPGEFATVDPKTILIVRDRESDPVATAAIMPQVGGRNVVVADGTTLSVPNTFPNIAPNNLPSQVNPVRPSSGMDKQQIQNLLQDREPLTKDNLIARHLAYMSVLYSRNGEYFQRLQSLLQGTFAQKMQIQ